MLTYAIILKGHSNTVIKKEIRDIILFLDKKTLENIINLPTVSKKFTVIRSPFVHKSSRDQFELIIHHKSLRIKFKSIINIYILHFFEKKLKEKLQFNKILVGFNFINQGYIKFLKFMLKFKIKHIKSF
jgi:ribosomal protein S10